MERHAKSACPVAVVASTLILFLSALLVLVFPSQAQNKSLIPVPRIQFLSTSGTPLANGHVHTSISGTTTPQATYTDAGGGTPNANPVDLDSGGFANIWLTPGESYTIAVHNSSDVQQYSIDGVTSGTLDTNLVVGTTAVTFTSTPTFNSATSVYFSMTLTGNVTSSTISNAIDGRVVKFNICQDATGGRTFIWPATVLNAPTIGSGVNVCTSVSYIFDGTNWRETAASSRGSAEFETVTSATYVDLIEQGSAPTDPAATTGRLYVLTADDILRIKRGATVIALVDDTHAQTIAGVKTFSSIPVLPGSDPTTSNEAARKAYVDSRKQIWRGGFYESAPTTGLTTIPLPVADQCAAGISVQRVTVAAITKGSGTMTFQVTRYSNAGVSQGNIFSGNQTYSNTGDNRQDYTVTTTTATANDYFRFNIVTLNGQTDVSFLVEGKCGVL